MKLIYKKMLPAEIILLGAFFLALALQQFGGYEFIIPSAKSGGWLDLLQSGIANYLKVFTLVFVVFILSLVMYRLKREGVVNKREIAAKALVFVRLFICYVGCIYFMLLFKWWSVLSPELWDGFYQQTDNILSGVMPLASMIDDALGIKQIYYFSIFAMFFVAAYLHCAIFHRAYFERVVTVGLCIMVLGGGAYMLFPAYGPFVFVASSDPVIAHAQGIMRMASDAYRSSGNAPDVGYFEAALGAMPSLHVAHTAAITAYMLSISRVQALPYVLGALYIAVYSTITQFHYVIDIFAGLIIAGIALIITELLFRNSGKKATL